MAAGARSRPDAGGTRRDGGRCSTSLSLRRSSGFVERPRVRGLRASAVEDRARLSRGVLRGGVDYGSIPRKDRRREGGTRSAGRRGGPADGRRERGGGELQPRR